MPGTFGTGPNQPGVKGTSTRSYGVEGSSQRGDGVFGVSSTAGRIGVHGYHGSVPGQQSALGTTNASTSSFGVLGELHGTDDGAGVKGTASSGDGVVGETSSKRKVGVIGVNHAKGKNDQPTIGGNGIVGLSSVPNASGMFGAHDNGGTGTSGHSDRGYGVRGTSRSGIGVYGGSVEEIGIHGESQSGRAIVGTSTSAIGVHGTSETGNGVVGHSNTQTGVQGTTTDGIGVYGFAPFAPKLRPDNTLDTKATLADPRRAALFEGLVEIRAGALVIGDASLNDMLDAIWKAIQGAYNAAGAAAAEARSAYNRAMIQTPQRVLKSSLGKGRARPKRKAARKRRL